MSFDEAKQKIKEKALRECNDRLTEKDDILKEWGKRCRFRKSTSMQSCKFKYGGYCLYPDLKVGEHRKSTTVNLFHVLAVLGDLHHACRAEAQKWKELFVNRPRKRKGYPYSNYITSEVDEFFEKAEKLLEPQK